MDQIFDFLSFAVQDNNSLLIAIAVVLPGSAVFFIVRHLHNVRQNVRRRVAAEPGQIAKLQSPGHAQLHNQLTDAVEKLSPLAGMPEKSSETYKQLQFSMIQAGYFSRNAVPLFFGVRLVCALLFSFVAILVCSVSSYAPDWMALSAIAISAFITGYFVPSVALSRRLERLKMEHRAGFPDFMDLMVVCSQAGMSMEAGMKRISDELASAYPSLAKHLELATIEIRNGKGVSRAVDSFAKRLNIEEASSFSTLLAQSEELGSSLSQSLRAYSDDMRNKRMMKAEEKAFALPAKLVVPLTLFVFPTLLVVIMLPVVIAVTQMT